MCVFAHGLGCEVCKLITTAQRTQFTLEFTEKCSIHRYQFVENASVNEPLQIKAEHLKVIAL